MSTFKYVVLFENCESCWPRHSYGHRWTVVINIVNCCSSVAESDQKIVRSYLLVSMLHLRVFDLVIMKFGLERPK